MERIKREQERGEERSRKPLEPPPPVVLALQRTAGNAAVTRLLARKPQATELRDWEIADELSELARIGLGDASIRSVQLILGTGLTGAFTSADVLALAQLHAEHRLNRGAWIGRRTLDVLVKRAVAQGMEEEAIQLVADYDKLGGDALSIHFSPSLAVASSAMFDPAGMRFIGIGRTALDSAGSIRRALRDALARTSPAAADPAVPRVLTAKQEAEAVRSGRYSLRDTRAIRAVQHAVRAPLSGFLDEDTAQALAAFQQSKGLADVHGMLDDPTFDLIVPLLGSTFAEDAAIRLVIDFRGIDERGVMDVAFDPAQADEVRIRSLATRAAASISFGQALFGGQPVERIVHRIARAFFDVDLRHRGVVQTDRRRFLLERFTMLSPGMAEEDFVPFMADAVQALAAWKDLDDEGRKALSAELGDLREKVRERWAQASPQLQQAFQATYDELLALPLP